MFKNNSPKKLNPQKKSIIDYMSSQQQLIKDYKDETGKKALWGGYFTKLFQKWNLDKLKSGNTKIVAFSDNKLFDTMTKKLVNKSTYFTKGNKLRAKYSKKNDIIIVNNTIVENVVKREKASDIFMPKLKRKIRYAENNDNNIDIPITIDNINRDVKRLLKVLRVATHNYSISIVDNNGIKKYFGINYDSLNRLSGYLETGTLMSSSELTSDKEIAEAILTNNKFELLVRGKRGKNQQNGGSFFPYTHKLKKVDLTRYAVFTKEQHDEDDGKYDVNCLCYALERAGYDTTPVQCLVRNRTIPQKEFKHVAELLDIHLTIRFVKDEKKKLHFGDKTKTPIEIGNIFNHYFLIEKTNYTSYSINNYDNIKDIDDFNKIVNNKNVKRKDKFISSYLLIKILYNTPSMLEELEYNNMIYKTCFHNEVKHFGSLKYNEKVNTNKVKFTENESNIIDTYYFDFETITGRNDKRKINHKPYCVYSDKHKNGFFGPTCGKQFLENIVEKYGVSVYPKNDEEKEKYKNMINRKTNIRLIAHNAGYDYRFLIEHLKFDTRNQPLEKGNSLLTAKFTSYYNNKVLSFEIRDSLKMINMGLGKFGKTFNLKVEKQMMPYSLYTEENVEKRYIHINECLENEELKGKKELFLENCKKSNCLNGDMVDILKYAGWYCYLDCITLKQGYEKFSGLVKEATGQNIENYLTLASLADGYLKLKGCYDDVFSISGVPRHFIQKCVVGGRCMTAENKKIIKLGSKKYKDYETGNGTEKIKISDFDAVSLYPSAMNRMDGFLKGVPKIIDNFEYVKNNSDGYFIEIKVLSVGKDYKFPCASYMTDKGIRNFTNDLVGRTIYLDKTGLEDLVNFQDVKYEFIKGYHYDEGRNSTIKETIKYVFEQRLKYKDMTYVYKNDELVKEFKTKKEYCKSEYFENKEYDVIYTNALQMVFKELMNSSYGKSYMKPIETEKRYIHKDDLDKTFERHSNNIKVATELFNGEHIKIDMIKNIDEHFNCVHVGVEILSMSKRIMYEVMSIAEDNKFNMYITDTDSIHIDTNKVEPLSELFKKKYNRELIGKGMGQFHTDFDLEGSCGEIYAIDCVFLGKKCYCDKLKSVDKFGKDIYGYHIRMKGVPVGSIIYKANTDYGGDVIELYKDLYEGKAILFDLLVNADGSKKCRFEFKKDMTIENKDEFFRKISF